MNKDNYYKHMIVDTLNPSGFIIDEQFSSNMQFSRKNISASQVTMLAHHNNTKLLFRGYDYGHFDKRIRDSSKIIVHRHIIDSNIHYTKWGQIDRRYKPHWVYNIAIVTYVWDKRKKQYKPIAQEIKNVPKEFVDMLFDNEKTIIGVW